MADEFLDRMWVQAIDTMQQHRGVGEMPQMPAAGAE